MVLLHNVELACDPHLLELVDLPPEAHPRPLHAELLYSNFYNIVSSIDLSISHRPGFQNFVARNKAHSGSEVHRLRPILLTSRQCNVFSQMGVSEESSPSDFAVYTEYPVFSEFRRRIQELKEGITKVWDKYDLSLGLTRQHCKEPKLAADLAALAEKAFSIVAAFRWLEWHLSDFMGVTCLASKRHRWDPGYRLHLVSAADTGRDLLPVKLHFQDASQLPAFPCRPVPKNLQNGIRLTTQNQQKQLVGLADCVVPWTCQEVQMSLTPVVTSFVYFLCVSLCSYGGTRLLTSGKQGRCVTELPRYHLGVLFLGLIYEMWHRVNGATEGPINAQSSCREHPQLNALEVDKPFYLRLEWIQALEGGPTGYPRSTHSAMSVRANYAMRQIPAILDHAAKNNVLEVRELLEIRGADPNYIHVRKDSWSVSDTRLEFYEEITPLVVAAEFGACDVIKVLFNHPQLDTNLCCCAFNDSEIYNYYTAYDMTISRKHPHAAALLRARGVLPASDERVYKPPFDSVHGRPLRETLNHTFEEDSFGAGEMPRWDTVLNDDYQTKGYQFKAKQKTEFQGAVVTSAVDLFPPKEPPERKDAASLSRRRHLESPESPDPEVCQETSVMTPAKLTWRLPQPFGVKAVCIDKLELDRGRQDERTDSCPSQGLGILQPRCQVGDVRLPGRQGSQIEEQIRWHFFGQSREHDEVRVDTWILDFERGGREQ
ncbi:hypothetical protein AK812_SmicGene17848 [Symbiodinium microadriaticum]|uniref:Uncharacterized protein n=1 Tax=Symbiodinium microadriaticum TaxID=2951 RepID=A0A1Q9DWR9_SYMMI|nr:hypothetical protein AK812_SmicGene17848 [Symbiodinium microadriaticum]